MRKDNPLRQKVYHLGVRYYIPQYMTLAVRGVNPEDAFRRLKNKISCSSNSKWVQDGKDIVPYNDDTLTKYTFRGKLSDHMQWYVGTGKFRIVRVMTNRQLSGYYREAIRETGRKIREKKKK